MNEYRFTQSKFDILNGDLKKLRKRYNKVTAQYIDFLENIE